MNSVRRISLIGFSFFLSTVKFGRHFCSQMATLPRSDTSCQGEFAGNRKVKKPNSPFSKKLYLAGGRRVRDTDDDYRPTNSRLPVKSFSHTSTKRKRFKLCLTASAVQCECVCLRFVDYRWLKSLSSQSKVAGKSTFFLLYPQYAVSFFLSLPLLYIRLGGGWRVSLGIRVSNLHTVEVCVMRMYVCWTINLHCLRAWWQKARKRSLTRVEKKFYFFFASSFTIPCVSAVFEWRSSFTRRSRKKKKTTVIFPEQQLLFVSNNFGSFRFSLFRVWKLWFKTQPAVTRFWHQSQ